jgi:hypothetical protein
LVTLRKVEMKLEEISALLEGFEILIFDLEVLG